MIGKVPKVNVGPVQQVAGSHVLCENIILGSLSVSIMMPLYSKLHKATPQTTTKSVYLISFLKGILDQLGVGELGLIVVADVPALTGLVVSQSDQLACLAIVALRSVLKS